MPRKSVITTYNLGLEAIEILPYNPKRIDALIVPDSYNYFGLIKVGNTANEAERNSSIYTYSFTVTISGINSVWAAIDPGGGTTQPITVIATLEE